MNRDIESLLAIAAVGAIAAAAAAAMAWPRTASADDITIETQPFVSSRTRGEVQQELLGQARQVRAGATEWSLQQGAVLKGQLTAPAVRADFVANRREVSALTAEDSGSSWLKMKPLPGSSTATMGGPRQ